MIEVWKDIKGFEGLYQVSNMGAVKALAKTLSDGKRRSEQLMAACKKENGYYFVSLTGKNGKKCYYIHRLVAAAFLYNPENKAQVNHKNSDKSDNGLENLEWVTRSENIFHSFKQGTHKPTRGTISTRAKLNESKVYDIKERYQIGGVTIRSLANEYGVHHSVIEGILKGKRWPHVQLKIA